MLNKRLLRVVVIVVVVALAGYGVVTLAKEQLRPVVNFVVQLLGGTKQVGESGDSGPSFTKDQDQDGLSDAKEDIYTTDPSDKDSDGDGILDGDEISAGQDPTVKGQQKISENPAMWQNLTVQYFEWARESTGAKDPQLSESAINTFFVTRKYDILLMPEIDDAELVIIPDEGAEANSKYLDGLASITLPPVTGNYLEVAADALRSRSNPIVDAIVQGLDDTISQIKRIPTPKEAITVQKGQLALLKVLKGLFLDLKSSRKDPVMLARDIGWGNQLIIEGGKVEKARQTLAAKGTIIRPAPTSPPTVPPTTPTSP